MPASELSLQSSVIGENIPCKSGFWAMIIQTDPDIAILFKSIHFSMELFAQLQAWYFRPTYQSLF